MSTLHRNYLAEEEKFLMSLQRNLKDQISRLKVEEISLLSSISNSRFIKETNTSHVQYASFSGKPKDSGYEYSDDSDENISLKELSFKLKSRNQNKKTDLEVNAFANEQAVNSIPLAFECKNWSDSRNISLDSKDEFYEDEDEVDQ